MTDLDKEAIVDFMEDHGELYDKTNEHFKNTARNECLWQRFANSHQLSAIWARPGYGKLMQSVKSGPKRDDGMSELDTG